MTEREKNIIELQEIIEKLTDDNLLELLISALRIRRQQRQWELYREQKGGQEK